jgi:hypothetical protein
MKTYRTEFHAGFSAVGLNPESIPAKNSGLLVDCMNVRVTKNGLEGYTPDIKSLLDGDVSFIDASTHVAITITKRWPFPQIFSTSIGPFIGALEGLFYLNPTDGTTPLELVNMQTGAVTWPWSCIPTAPPIFTCGDVLIYWDNVANTYKVKTYA